MVVQFLYTDQNFDSPFLLTYIGTSLFVLLLPSRMIWERRHVCTCTSVQDEAETIPWRTSHAYEHVPSTSEAVSLENVQMDQRGSSDSFDDNNDDDKSSHDPQWDQQQHAEESSVWSHEQHFKVALQIAPVWFVANWAYNASLAYTSITSSTVLASTGSLFTFLFAVLYGDETFTCFKLAGVLLGVSGSILTGLHDASSLSEGTNDDALSQTINATLTTAGHVGMPHHITPTNNDAWQGHALWGDALGLLSAVGYGAYAVMIRIKCPRDERLMSMQLLLGYIGLFNACLLSPIAIRVLVWPSSGSGSDAVTTTVHGLTWVVFGYLVAKGLLDNVLSDYLWARAVVLTSATVATVGLGLTIPLAFVSDWVMGHGNVASAQSVLGALAVLAGFILVNVGNKEETVQAHEHDDTEEVLDETL